MHRQIKCKTEYYEKTDPPYRNARSGRDPALCGASLPLDGPRGGRTGKAVEYATVVLLKGTEQVAGMATDAEGRFALKAAPGEYTLLIQYLGFDP